jgi:hypothetical protein
MRPLSEARSDDAALVYTVAKYILMRISPSYCLFLNGEEGPSIAPYLAHACFILCSYLNCSLLPVCLPTRLIHTVVVWRFRLMFRAPRSSSALPIVDPVIPEFSLRSPDFLKDSASFLRPYLRPVI